MRGAPAVAVSCLRRALAEPPRPDDRAGVLVELASAEVHGGQLDVAAQHFDEGLRDPVDPRLRANSVREYAVALQALGRNEEAFAVRERAVAEVASIDEQLALSLEAGIIASAGLDLSRRDWARRRLDSRRRRLDADSSAASRLLAMQAYFDALYGTAPASDLADAAERTIAAGGLV